MPPLSPPRWGSARPPGVSDAPGDSPTASDAFAVEVAASVLFCLAGSLAASPPASTDTPRHERLPSDRELRPLAPQLVLSFAMPTFERQHWPRPLPYQYPVPASCLNRSCRPRCSIPPSHPVRPTLELGVYHRPAFCSGLGSLRGCVHIEPQDSTCDSVTVALVEGLVRMRCLCGRLSQGLCPSLSAVFMSPASRCSECSSRAGPAPLPRPIRCPSWLRTWRIPLSWAISLAVCFCR
jgi:hypothetical protein